MAEMDEGPALWRRYQQGSAPEQEPGALQLAAYAENRLGPAETETVERWLARNPARLDDVLAARAALTAGAVPLGRRSEIRAACALVRERVQEIGTRVMMWRSLGWGSVAAGFVFACLVGYAAGDATKGHMISALSTAGQEISFVVTVEEPLGTAMGLGDAGEEL